MISPAIAPRRLSPDRGLGEALGFPAGSGFDSGSGSRLDMDTLSRGEAVYHLRDVTSHAHAAQPLVGRNSSLREVSTAGIAC